jgi:heme a synthase
MPVARWIRRLALAGVLLCFIVVVLGAYVRLNAAGLGCPDWPGCYGHVTPIGAAENNVATQAAFPDRPLDTGKAWKEMVHRYAAGTLVLIVVVITALAVTYRRKRLLSVPYVSVLLATIVAQAALGMLTVTWLLKPLIVTLHLVFGMTTLGLLWWLWLSLPSRPWGGMTLHNVGRPGFNGGGGGGTGAVLRIAHRLALIGLVALAIQITLGGWTSSNYAAVACPDFPTCQNAWWPHADYRNAFVLWHGLSINYEGGILDNPARVAIHLTHRVGALVATLALLFASAFILVQKAIPTAKPAAYAVLGALALQLTIGISMVLKAFPLRLTTAHTAGAALLLLAALTLVRRVSVR